MKHLSLFFVFLMLQAIGNGQNNKLRFNLNDSGSRYAQFTFLSQIWLRYTEMNPYTSIDGGSASELYDIGLRRTRMQLFGTVAENTFFYTQFGMNNFNHLSERYEGAFFHDVLIEQELVENALSLGGGLSGWNGLSRYASPSVGSILTVDAPLFQQATNGVNDQFRPVFEQENSMISEGKRKMMSLRRTVGSRPDSTLSRPDVRYRDPTVRWITSQPKSKP